MKNTILKLNHIFFWWYYKRVPKFFHKWTLLRSISLLVQNYEHALHCEKEISKVLDNAIKRESVMLQQISNMRLKIQGFNQSEIDEFNAVFKTRLKINSNKERNN